MLKAIPGYETVQHLCEGMTLNGSGEYIKFDKPRNLGEREGVKIMMHDIHPYLFIEETKKMYHITYCPYCGANIDREERP